MENKTPDEWKTEYAAELSAALGQTLSQRAIAYVNAFVDGVITYDAKLVTDRIKHPYMNPVGRKIFARMTGLKLPMTIEGVRELVKVWAMGPPPPPPPMRVIREGVSVGTPEDKR